MMKTLLSHFARIKPCGRSLISSRNGSFIQKCNFSVELAEQSDCRFLFSKALGDSSVNVRKAKLSDYETVISIPQHKKTYDDLPDRYCALIISKTNSGYIVNIDGKDVAFQLTHLVDGGATLVLNDLRVHKDTDTDKMQSVLQSICKLSSSNTTIICASDNLPNNNQLRLGETNEWRLVTKRTKEVYSTNMANLLLRLRSSGLQLKASKRLFSHDMKRLFHTPISFARIFKDNRVLKSGILFRPIPANIPLFMDKRTLVIGSNIHEEKYALYSFGTYSHTTHGLHCAISFHGNLNRSLEEHVFIQMMSLLNRSNMNVSLEVCADGDTDLLLVTDIMKTFGFERDEQFLRQKDVTWYQRAVQ